MPRFTPSRVPLLDQRWTVVPPERRRRAARRRRRRSSAEGRRPACAGATSAPGFEYSLSFFDGFNHLPNVERRSAQVGQARCRSVVAVARDAYPAIRTYGARRGGADAVVHDQGRGGVLHVVDAADRRVRAVRGAARAADRRVGARRRLRRRGGDDHAACGARVRARPRPDALDRRRARRTRSIRTAASRSRPPSARTATASTRRSSTRRRAASTGARRSPASASRGQRRRLPRPVPPQLPRRARASL